MFKVGDRARPKDDTGEVAIVEVISSSSVKATDEHGFTNIYKTEHLVRIDPKDSFIEARLSADAERSGPKGLSKNRVASNRASEKKRPPAGRTGKKLKRHPGVYYINLHAEAVPKRYKAMQETPILQQQMDYFDDELRKVFNGNYHQMEINHGIGEGILKKAVTNRLTQYGLEFRDHSYTNIGTTVVVLGDEL